MTGADALHRIITARKITQRVASQESGVAESKLSRILSGKAVPNLREAVALRNAFGVDPGIWAPAPQEVR